LFNDYLKNKRLLYNKERGHSIDTHSIWDKPDKDLQDAGSETEGSQIDLLNGGSRMLGENNVVKSSRLLGKEAAKEAKGKEAKEKEALEKKTKGATEATNTEEAEAGNKSNKGLKKKQVSYSLNDTNLMWNTYNSCNIIYI
jgi:hypothetical protein